MRLTAEQRVLQATVRSLLTRHANTRSAMESPTGYDEVVWTRLCDMGVPALPLPETCIVAMELGRTLTPAPFLGSAVLAGTALAAAGDTRLLPRITSGESLAALVIGDYILDGDLADILLVGASDGLYEVARARRTQVTTLDPTRRLATVEVEELGPRIGDSAVVAHAVDIARIALAAEQVGAAGECLRRTIAYTMQRIQFDRPIATFQVIRHRLADLHVAVQTAGSAMWAAAQDPTPIRAAVASRYCTEVFQKVAAEMIQLHGGIAITWEHDAHLYFKRAHSSAQLFPVPMAELAQLAGIVNG